MSNAILGVKPHYDGLEIAPCIPAEWDGFEATREFRGCRFEISVVRGADKGLVLNGVKLTGSLIPAASFAAVNEVRLTI
jgi:cellobiose phosphorylase